ncbi:MAG TPA: transposase [Armatimonadota bacterium]|nr:transposase [Armatimonadota bacterium]
MASREFSREFKLQVVGEIESGQKSVIRICREHSLCDSVVRRWLEQYRQRGAEAFQTGDPQADALAAAEKQIRDLQGALGRSVMEVNFLKECLKRAHVPLPPSARW